MAVTPHTNIKLLNVPLHLDNKNQLTFNNATEQYNYFNSLESYDLYECSYQRKDSVMRIPFHIDTIQHFNYCIYQNDNYSNKWFYAFITNMTYINDNCTAVTIATDVFQTWQFDIIYKQSFIEREMCNVADDRPDSNLLAESLETGEFTVNQNYNISDLEPIYIVAFLRRLDWF